MTCSYSKEFSSVAFTDVENVFIYEYLPVASGNAVKVYLYGLFLCQNANFNQTISEFANNVGLTESQVKDCFKYWEEFGLVSVISEEPYSVQYLPVRSVYSGKPRKFKAEKYTDFTKGLQSLLPARMISTNEYSEYFSIMEDYGIKPEAMLLIVKYCADKKGEDIGYKYISKVAKDFGNRGIVTVDKVEKELQSYVLRTSEIEKILKALSLRRQPDIEDLNYYKKWTNELTFEPENIVFAASKMKRGSMAKLDDFLMDLYSVKSFSKEEIAGYMADKQRVFDLTLRINHALSIYVEVIDTEVDAFVKKWLSYGYEDDTLLYIASHCFKIGKNNLQYMDELIETLRTEGFIDISSVGDYFERSKKIDLFIQDVLTACGVNRRPTPWDRENYKIWKSWNFSDEMILEAAKLSGGKSSPIPYMNGVLSNWKNNSLFTVEEVSNQSTVTDSVADYNMEYERRRGLAVQKAQKNIEKAMKIDGFADMYARTNSIEKDLAFAEIAGNEQAIKTYEEEKKELYDNIKSLLSSIGLTLDDLSPIYSCKKCNDTGYIGDKRCDCFNKK